MRYIIVVVFTCVSLLSGNAQTDEIILEKALFNLPDVTFTKVSKPGDTYLQYMLTLRQPLDHQQPEKGYYDQQVILTHKDFKSPTVMNISGYTMPRGKNEITQMLHANELSIEYRYFGKSRPDSLQWEYLNYDQVMSDLHRINLLFREIYSGKWISTGISRGGQTAIIYKYYYPEDVDISVPYVAPMIDGPEDKRIYDFLDTMGTDECRSRIRAFQVYVLKHEKEILEKLKWYSKGKKLNYDYLGSPGKAFEYAVLEYPFSFWQVTDKACEDIPLGKTIDEHIDHLLDVVDLESFSDKSMRDYQVHYYQAAVEGGYYGYDARSLKKYLKYMDTDNPSGSFPPKSASIKLFDDGFMDRIFSWLDEQGNDFIYIYGGRDTWSACRVNITPKVNSRLYMLPGANHFAARVKNMPPAMKQDFADAFRKLADLTIDLEALK
jgi:hypothetical protein